MNINFLLWEKLRKSTACDEIGFNVKSLLCKRFHLLENYIKILCVIIDITMGYIVCVPAERKSAKMVKCCNNALNMHLKLFYQDALISVY